MKPFMPGSAIDDSVTSRNAATSRGITRLEPAELRDQARVPAIRQHADDHEEAARAHAVVEHLVDRSLHAPARSSRTDRAPRTRGG